MAADPLYYDVSALLHGNGVNGSTTFTDDSGSPKTFTDTGSGVTITTAQSVFGGASINFDGSSYLETPTDTDFVFPADVTIECWFRHNITTSGDYPIISCGATGAGSNSALIFITGFQLKGYVNSNNINSGVFPDVNTWYKVVLQRLSGVWELLVVEAGEYVSKGTRSSATSISDGDLCIGGAITDFTNSFVGQIDDVRITKGYARYVSGDPVETEEYGGAPVPNLIVMSLTAPRHTLAMSFGAQARLTAPGHTLAMRFGIKMPLTAPRHRLNFTNDGITNTWPLTAPRHTLAMRFGLKANLTAPRHTLAMSGTFPTALRLSLTAPGHALVMNITAPELLRFNLRAPRHSLRMFTGGRIAGSAPRHTVAMQISSGSLLQFALTGPRHALSFSLSNTPGLTFHLTAPGHPERRAMRFGLTAPRHSLAMLISEVVTVTYEAYALNLRHDDEKSPHQVTRYTNYPFDQIICLDGDYYGVAADGIYLIGGDTDYATPQPNEIEWAWRTALSDFGAIEMKTIRNLYLGGRLASGVEVDLQVGEKRDVTYRYTTRYDTTAQNYRVKLGLGIKARYYGLAAAGTGEMELATIDPEIFKLSRRIPGR